MRGGRLVTRVAPLTRREREIARLVSEGLGDREISAKLFLSRRTVEWHLEQIRNKLGVSSRAQIAALIVREDYETSATITAPGPLATIKLPRALCPVLVARERNINELEQALAAAVGGEGR